MAKGPEEVLLARLRAVPRGEQGRIAGLAGISPAHLSRWLNGEIQVNPKLETLKLLADALGLGLGEMLTDTEAEPVPTIPVERVVAARERLVEAQQLLGEAVGGGVAADARAFKRARKARTRPRHGAAG